MRTKPALPTLLLLLLLPLPLLAQAGEVEGIRFSKSEQRTRVVLDLSDDLDYAASTRRDPERVVLDLAGSTFACSTSPRDLDSGTVFRVRCNRLRRGAQVVLDLKGAYAYEVFRLEAVPGSKPARLVVDILPEMRRDASARPLPFDRDVVVVLDPGHGGRDPGAIRSGVKEKDIALDVARRLKKELEGRGGYKVVLTREGDSFPTLYERRQRAEAARGDLFLSIHCNSSPTNSQVRGVELFYLSLRGASNRKAQILADRENAADAVGGVMNGASHQDVKLVLDERMRVLLRRSYLMAEEAHRRARQSPDLRSRGVKRASFAVCKNLNMPSVLVELGYMSNARELRFMNSSQGRERYARWLADSVDAYLRKNAESLDDPLFSDREKLVYKVRRGDNLSRIASRFGVPLEELKEINHLARADQLKAGQRLVVLGGEGRGIPAASREHVVREGENLSLIAQRYGVSLRQLMSWNRLRDANHIRPGQTLAVGTAKAAPRVHQVRRGENLSLIAKRYDVSVRQLVRSNGLKNPNDIRPGQKLLIDRQDEGG